MKIAQKIILTEKERLGLEKIVRSFNVRSSLKERAKIILLASKGLENIQISEELDITRQKVARWRKRFHLNRASGIEKDLYRPGRPLRISEEKKAEILRITLEEAPNNRTHWSRSSLSKKVGVSPSTIGRIWKLHGIKPHLHRTFKVSNDPNFKEKIEDIIGLYLSPPEHAIVLSCDEKSQIQALDRTQPSLPLKKGRNQTFTHDYKRNGTTTLFAALEISCGKVISSCMKRHRHQEWIKFLNKIKRSVPKDKEIHIICDNYSTHKHENVKLWQKNNPQFHFHFTPTSASWLNMVERFFRDISENRIRRGVFYSESHLIEAIEEYIKEHNKNPKPFIWTASAKDILEKVKRAREVLNKLQN